jgi:CubicO group peptidase (beta-lactamase class C family)
MRVTSFYVEKGAINPSSGAVSSAADYLNFLTMLMNKGMFNGRKILSEASVAELMKAHYTTDLPVRSMPKAGEGYRWAPGAWISEADASGNALVMNSDGLTGTYAWIDRSRNYAAVIITKTLRDEQKRDTYLLIKDEVEAVIR